MDQTIMRQIEVINLVKTWLSNSHHYDNATVLK